MRYIVLKIVGVLFSMIISGSVSAVTGDCGKECMEGFLDQYMDALLAQEPSSLSLSNNVRFTENGQKLNLGEALWGSISGLRDYRVYMSDPQAGQAALFTVVEE